MNEDANLNIVLTGSAGYLGSRVKALLIGLGFNVIALDKQELSNPVDLADYHSLSKAPLPSNYNLIHLAFPLPGKLKEKEFTSTINSINKNLISRLNPKRTLLISSTAVYPLEAKNLSEPNPWEIYGRLKRQSEVEFSTNFNSLTVFRPGTLIENSRESTMMGFLRMLLNSPFSFIPGKGNVIHPFTATDDLVQAVLHWSRYPETPSGIFDLVAAEPLTFAQIRSQSRGTQRSITIGLPIWGLRKIGSDKLPFLGVSKWHFRALTYDVNLSSRNVYSQNFSSYSSLMSSL